MIQPNQKEDITRNYDSKDGIKGHYDSIWVKVGNRFKNAKFE